MKMKPNNFIPIPPNSTEPSMVPQAGVVAGGSSRPATQGGLLDPALRRTKFFLDLENLAGGTRFDGPQIAGIAASIIQIVGLRDDDQYVIGSSHYTAERSAYHVRELWHGCRHVVLSGPDGADCVLIDALLEETRVDDMRIVIGSGDGIFAAASRELQERGASVIVVAADAASLSGELRSTTDDVRFLSDAIHSTGSYASYPGQNGWS